MKKTMLLLSMGALMLAAVPAEARRGHRGMMKGKRIEMMKANLNLTDGQVQQMKAIHTDARARSKSFRAQIRPLRKQMRLLLQADTINEAQVVALRSRIRSLRQIVGEQRFQAKLKLMRVLTKEQRIKMMELRKQRRSKRGFGKRCFNNGNADKPAWGRTVRSTL